MHAEASHLKETSLLRPVCGSYVVTHDRQVRTLTRLSFVVSVIALAIEKSGMDTSVTGPRMDSLLFSRFKNRIHSFPTCAIVFRLVFQRLSNFNVHTEAA